MRYRRSSPRSFNLTHHADRLSAFNFKAGENDTPSPSFLLTREQNLNGAKAYCENPRFSFFSSLSHAPTISCCEARGALPACKPDAASLTEFSPVSAAANRTNIENPNESQPPSQLSN